MESKEVFEIVRQHLMAQGVKSIDSGVRCSYRGAAGLKCAVGVLMSDEDYKPEYDTMGYSLGSIVPRCPSLAGIDIELLRVLQQIHDSEDWEARLTEVCARYGF